MMGGILRMCHFRHGAIGLSWLISGRSVAGDANLNRITASFGTFFFSPGIPAFTMKQTNLFGLRSGCLAIGLTITASTIQFGMGSRSTAQNELIKSKRDTAGTIAFREVAAEAGVSFRFDTGSRGRHDLPEIMGGGVAIFDADGDGRLDIYFCNGGPIDAGSRARPTHPAGCIATRETGIFEDITDRAGAPGPSYAMGAAVGDYDGDGRVDLFVTGWRDQRLYRNLGGGRFEDVTRPRRPVFGPLEHVGGVRRSRRRRRSGPLRGELSRF